MSFDFSKPLTENSEILMKMLAIVLKLGAFIGIACVIAYSIAIGYYPQGLSLGDGILFATVALSFGMIYILFVICVSSLGSFYFLLLRMPIIKQLLNKLLAKNKALQYGTPPMSFNLAVFGAFGGIMVWGLSAVSPQLNISLWLLPVLLFGAYWIYTSTTLKIHDAQEALDSRLVLDESEQRVLKAILSTQRGIKYLMLSVIIALPLILGGMTSKLIELSMHAANIRIKNSIVYVKEPYASLIGSEWSSKQKKLADYKAFSDLTVLLTGYGTMTVVSFEDGDKTRTLQIPNDHLIIEKLPN
jgi:hypothetical protein